MSPVADDLEDLRKHRAGLKRRDGALRAAIRARLERSFRRPSAFAGAALLGAAIGLLHPHARHERATVPAQPSFARWLVIAAEHCGPLLSLAALARRRRGAGDERTEHGARMP